MLVVLRFSWIVAALVATVFVEYSIGGSSAAQAARDMPAPMQRGSVRGAQALPGRQVHVGVRRILTAPACSGSGSGAFIGGGTANIAGGEYSGILVGNDDMVCDESSAIAGGGGNVISSGANTSYNSFIGSGTNNSITGSSHESFIGSGLDNSFSGNSNDGVIAGGFANSMSAQYATIGGGYSNMASGNYAFIGGGALNADGGPNAMLGAGGKNTIASGGGDSVLGGGYSNTVAGLYAFLGGGYENSVPGAAAALSGGFQNSDGAANAMLGAGESNTIASGGTDSVLAGGKSNTIASGGTNSVLAGGSSNTVSAHQAVIAGGYKNSAAGEDAMIPGGSQNTASGVLSFAGGYRADAVNAGSFVWSDYVDGSAVLKDTAADQFVVRASGGTFFYSNEAATSGVELAAGSGAWANLSDRNAKTDVAPLDDASILAKVATLPVSIWSYKSEGAVKHMGPMAQDFYAAFRVGADDRHITSIDEDGVALAAIKALHAENARMHAENAALRDRLAALEQKVAALGREPAPR